jgi:hypothetical protein
VDVDTLKANLKFYFTMVIDHYKSHPEVMEYRVYGRDEEGGILRFLLMNLTSTKVRELSTVHHRYADCSRLFDLYAE